MIEPQEQAAKLIELAKLKAEHSASFRSTESYLPLIEKIFLSNELLTEEECTQATSKEFGKAITGLAQSTAKVAQWHQDNKAEEAIAFLMPVTVKTIEQATPQPSLPEWNPDEELEPLKLS